MKRQQWKNSGKTLENTGMAADESQKQKWGDRWSKEWRQNSSFCVSNKISVILRIRSWNHNFRNTKFELFSEETLRKMVQDRMQYLLSKDHLRHKWRLQRSWISYPDYQDAQDKQQTQYQLTPRSKMEDAPEHLKIPKSECPDIWIRLPKHKWPKSWSNMEDPVVPLERNLYGHPLAGLLWERQFEKSYWNMAGRKFQIGNVSLFIVKKGYSCVYVEDFNLFQLASLSLPTLMAELVTDLSKLTPQVFHDAATALFARLPLQHRRSMSGKGCGFVSEPSRSTVRRSGNWIVRWIRLSTLLTSSPEWLLEN